MRVRLAFAADGMEEKGAGDAEGVGSAGGGESADSARSLYRWLVGDPELRGHAEVTAPAQTKPGHMGGVLDVVDVVLSNTIALSGLVVSVATWRGARPRPPRVRLERDGVQVSVEGASPEAIAQVLRALEAGAEANTDAGGDAGGNAESGPGGDDSRSSRERTEGSGSAE
jgi:hypothetical protein